jgi:hypothetical protein
MKIFFGLMFMCLVSGCATTYDQSKFVDYSSNTYYELSENLKYTEKRGMGITWEQGLKKGKYFAKHQDEYGFYFVGPASAVCLDSPKCKEFYKEGGIWISKKDKNDIRLFSVYSLSTVAKKDAYKAGALVGFLINSGNGTLSTFSKNQNFIKKILSAEKDKTNKLLNKD